MIILVGAHSNMPAPDVPQALAEPLQAVVAAGGRVGVVAIDGRPRLVLPPTKFPVSSANPAARSDDIAAATNDVLGQVRAARAATNGSDVLGALSVAADSAAAADIPHAQLVVIDSMLPDTGDLDLTVPGMLSAAPGEVAKDLAARGALPDLAGHEVLLVGVGYTSPPQHPLGTGQRRALTDMWSAVIRAAHGAPRVLPVPRSAPPAEGPYTTRTVPIPSTEPLRPRDVSLTEDSSLGFFPNSTTFRDPVGARKALTKIAAWLAASPGRTVKITGTCASVGSAEGRKRLSTQRAEAVRRLLLDLHVPAAQISAVGAGYIASPPDRRSDGTLDPAAAALNRSIRLSFAESR
jgi:outer membrane protein OmpA-like peptidoglycan-associated protein